MLGEFYLQLPFPGAGAPGEDVQDEGNTVDDFDFEVLFQVVLLEGRQLIIENSDIVVGFPLEQLFQLAFAEVVAPGGRAQILNDSANNDGAGGFCQLRQLLN